MRLTNFGSVVSTYKKNFQLRKKKFIDDRKKIIDEKRKEREDEIEAVKAVEPLIKKINFGKGSKSNNFLGGIQRFLGFALAGFILQNLKNILPILQEIYKKIEDLVKGTKKFVEGAIGGLQTFFEGLDSAKQKMDDLLSPILNADLSKFVPFQDQLDKVLTGVLGIAALITGLYQGGKAGGDGNIIDETAKGSAQGVNIAAQRKAARLKALQEAKELRAQKQAQRIAAREAVAKRLRAESNLIGIARGKAAQRAAQKAAKEAAEGTRRINKVYGKTSAVGATIESSSRGASGTSGSVDISSIKSIPEILEEDYRRLTNKQLHNIKNSPDYKIDADQRSAATKILNERMKKARYFSTKEVLKTFFDDTPKIDTKKYLNQDVSFSAKKLNIPMPPKTTSSKFNQIMKNARGFIKPKNLKLLRGFAKDLGAGLAIEFFAGWAIDRGLEAIGRDEKTLLKERVKRFNQLPKEEQKSLIETYNNNLEKELEYQKSFFAKVDKVVALGDMTANEIKIKALTSFLTAVSISGAGSVYDLVSAGPLPDYLGDNVDITLPSNAKISMPSGMPPLPPTGTGRFAAAQQYGAGRDDNKDGIIDRRHAGQDFDPADDKNSKFYSRIGGEVIYAKNAGGGYGNVVDIYNAKLGVTERIAEGDRIHVKVGDIVKPGTLVQSGSTMTGVFHYEIRKGKAGPSGKFRGTVNPLEFLEQLKKNQNQASIKTSPSNLISSAGLNQSTTYSDSGVAIRREVNNIIIPIAA